MSQELVPISDSLAEQESGERMHALQALADEALTVESVDEAHEVIQKARALSELLKLTKAPFEEAWLAGKAAVIASRRLSLLIAELPVEYGPRMSQRHKLISQLGLKRTALQTFVRLARVPDADYQRYIQDPSQIPTVNGLLNYSGMKKRYAPQNGTFYDKRKRRAGVKTPRNSSIDEAYSLLVRCLGHVGGSTGGVPERRRDVSRALHLLYEAENCLRPWRGGIGV